MKRPKVEPGDWTVVCDVSGFRVLASETRKQWDNSIAWERVWTARQPQDYLRGIPDNMTVPFSRPKTDPNFIETNAVSAEDL